MKRMTRQKALNFIIKTLAIFALISAVYLVALYKPRSTQSLTRDYLIKRQDVLTQNRLAIIKLISLNSNSGTFIDEQTQAYYVAEKSIKDGKQLADEPLLEQASTELKEQFSGLNEELKNILEVQSSVLDEQKQIDRKLVKVFEYTPSLDLPSADADDRVKAAIEGLRKAKDAYSEASNLVDEVQSAFVSYKTNRNLNTLEKTYSDFKAELYKLKIKPLTGEDELSILARQTTLINKFEYFIDSLEE